MPSMPSINRGRGSSGGFKRTEQDSGAGLVAVLLIAISLVMFVLSARENGSGPMTAIRSGFQTITTPVRFIGTAVTAPTQGLGNVMRNLTADQATLTELEQQNAQLTSENAKLKESAATAERLQKLLDVKGTYNLQSTAANIISGSTDSWTATVTLDKGSAAGLGIGMPVMDSNGAIGEIIECSATSSTVRLLQDENSSVSAMLQESRAQGMLKGSPDGTLSLTLINTDQTVNVGDSVVTSGLGGVFPKGIPVGTVADVQKVPGALYYSIKVSPISAAGEYGEVLVVTSLTADQQATSEEISAADSQDAGSSAGALTGSSADGGSSASSGSTSSEKATTTSETGDSSGEGTAESGASDDSGAGGTTGGAARGTTNESSNE